MEFMYIMQRTNLVCFCSFSDYSQLSLLNDNSLSTLLLLWKVLWNISHSSQDMCYCHYIFQVAGVLVILVLFIHFLAALHSMQHLSSPNSNQTVPLAVDPYRVLITGPPGNSLEFCVFIPQMPPQSVVRLFAYIQHDAELSLDPVAFHTCLSCLTMCLNFFVFISIFYWSSVDVQYYISYKCTT